MFLLHTSEAGEKLPRIWPQAINDLLSMFMVIGPSQGLRKALDQFGSQQVSTIGWFLTALFSEANLSIICETDVA